MLAWLLQDSPIDTLAAMCAQIAQGHSFEQSLLDNYSLSVESFVSAFSAQAERITQLSWPYTEPPPWYAWINSAWIIAMSIASVALLVLARFGWWLRQPVSVSSRRLGLGLRRYIPRTGSFRF